jgi:hypothetical protein
MPSLNYELEPLSGSVFLRAAVPFDLSQRGSIQVTPRSLGHCASRKRLADDPLQVNDSGPRETP